MKTTFRESEEVIVIDFQGFLNFECQEPLRQNLASLSQRLNAREDGKQVVFNFTDLEFVGSSGISTFLNTLADFSNQATLPPRYYGVRSEFQRLMKALADEAIFEFYDDEENAVRGSKYSH